MPPVAAAAANRTVAAFKPVGAGILFTPGDFGIPARDRPFTPTELARHLNIDAKTVIRMIESGILRALPLHHGTYRIPYIEIVYFFLRQQGILS